MKYLETIRKVYKQQKYMLENNTHKVPDRIVIIMTIALSVLVTNIFGSFKLAVEEQESGSSTTT